MHSSAAPYSESRLTRSVANERAGFPVVEQHLEYFAQSCRAKVGGPQISSTNCKSANLQTYTIC
jgi:hypothetical protein